MAGIGLVWSIAKDALFAQRYGIDVTAHNIANVNTPGFSRQTPVFEAKVSATQGQLVPGRGVGVNQVMQAADQFIENRLMQQKSNLMYFGEMSKNVRVLEGLFNEKSETGIGAMMADFWNLWQDISNNPSGSSERSALYGYSLVMTERLNSLDMGLKSLAQDLTRNVDAGIAGINLITAEIAELNGQIVAAGTGRNPNDMKDKRNNLLTELSGYMDVKSFEQENGALTVVSARGSVLVQGTDDYNLSLGGVNGDRVVWLGSEGRTIDITDYIRTGTLGGWLDMRDQVLAECKLNLDALTKELVWTVNRQHTQGVGLAAVSSMTGSYSATYPSAAVGTSASGLVFYDKITDGSFKLWLYDENGNPVAGGAATIIIDAGLTPLYDNEPTTNDIVSQINAVHADISASLVDGKLRIGTSNGHTFAFSDDSSNVLAAIGINAFFTGAGAGSIGVSNEIGNDLYLIAAARVDADGVFTAGDNQNALALSELQYAALNIPRWTCDRASGNKEGRLSGTLEDYYHAFVGSIGIAAESVSRSKSFHATMLSNIAEIRDGISAVSLDEEMTNLMKYQHAYTAAAKLIRVADEMLSTLLQIK